MSNPRNTKSQRALRNVLLTGALALALCGCTASSARPDCSANCSDAQITQAVRERLFDDAGVLQTQISVLTVDGVVYLHGLVGTSVERSRALALAGAVPGVVRVVDSLELHDSQ